MLLTIVDTKSYGKFVLHLFPYRILDLPKDQVTPIELTQSLTTAFQYFGIYRKADVISTSSGSLKEGTVVDLLEANQKYTQLLMGIDQNCVLISKSVFLDSSKQYFHNLQYPTHNIELGQFISLNDTQSSIVNSISLVYRQQNFSNIQMVKHKLAFLISALQLKQKHQKYLSKQISLIVQQKNQFKRILKQKCQNYLKENNMIYEEFKIKMIYKEIQTEASLVLKKIHIFQLLEKIYNNWDKKDFFKQETFEDQFIGCINSINYKIPTIQQSKQKAKQIQNKTIITIPQKLNNIPSVLYPQQRIQYIYDRLLVNNIKPLKNIISTQLQMGTQSIYHTIYFLIHNDLASCVFPFDSEKYYTLYTLKSMPDKKIIQKFNSLFQGEDILQYLKKFQKYHRIKYLDEKVKYLILNKIIKEVGIYIQKLEPVNNNGRGNIWTSSIYHKQRKPSFDVRDKEKDNKVAPQGSLQQGSKLYPGASNKNTLNIPQQQYIPPFVKLHPTVSTSAIHPGQKVAPQDKPTNNSSLHPVTGKNIPSVNNSAIVQSILNTHVSKPQQINYILSKCRDKGVKMIDLINFVKYNSNYWKFIFVENGQ